MTERDKVCIPARREGFAGILERTDTDRDELFQL